MKKTPYQRWHGGKGSRRRRPSSDAEKTVAELGQRLFYERDSLSPEELAKLEKQWRQAKEALR